MAKQMQKRSARKKVFRIALVLFLAVFAVIAALIITLRLLYPPQKLQKMATDYFHEEFNRELLVGDIRFNLFKGFVFKDITIPPVPDSALSVDFPIRSLNIEKVAVGYNLRQLLQRKFIVHHITIHQPRLDLYITSGGTKPGMSEKEESATTHLPLAIDLHQLCIDQLQATVLIDQDSIATLVNINNVYLDVNDVSLPKGEMDEHSQELVGKASLGIDRGRFLARQYRIATPDQFLFDTSGRIDWEQQISIKGLDDLAAQTQLSLTDMSLTLDSQQLLKSPLPRSMGLFLQGRADLSAGQASIKQARVDYGETPWVSLSGDLFLTDNPEINAKIDKSQIPLQQIVEIASCFVENSLLNAVRKKRLKSALVFSGSELSGKLGNDNRAMDVGFVLKCLLTDFNLSFKPEIYVDQMNFSTLVAGSISETTINSLHADIGFDYDSLEVALNDSLDVSTGPVRLVMNTDLARDFLPKRADFHLDIDHIFGADVSATAQVNAASSLADLSAGASINVSSLNMADISNQALSTTANLDVEFAFVSWDSVTLHAGLHTDSVRLHSLDSQIVVPLRFDTRMSFSADTTFEHISLNQGAFTLNDFASGRVRAALNRRRQKVDVSQLELKIDHEPLYQSLPSHIHQQLYDFSITGSTSARGSGWIGYSQAAPQFQADAKVFIKDTDFRYPSENLEIENFNLEGKASTESGRADIFLHCNQVFTPALRRFAYEDNSLSMQILSDDFKTFNIENGTIKLADLAKGDFSAKLDSTFQIKADCNLYHQALDSVEVMDNIWVQGQAQVHAAMVADTSLIALDMILKTDDYCVFPGDSFAVHNMNTSLNVHQTYDLRTQRLVAKDGYTVLTPAEGLVDFLLVKDYYPGELSSLTIDSVTVIGYKISNLIFEIDMGESYLEVPRLSADLYGGLLAGRLSLDLAEGVLENASWRVSSHFSNVNSELLLSTQDGKTEKSVINGNLEIFGNGMDPQKEIEIGGHFYITRVGPAVVTNILKSLDPRGEDANVSLSLRLLSWGFQPDVLTFDIRHRYLRPVIAFKQPWYFPVRLSGGKIELARVPVNFFVQNALRQMLTASQP